MSFSNVFVFFVQVNPSSFPCHTELSFAPFARASVNSYKMLARSKLFELREFHMISTTEPEEKYEL